MFTMLLWVACCCKENKLGIEWDVCCGLIDGYCSPYEANKDCAWGEELCRVVFELLIEDEPCYILDEEDGVAGAVCMIFSNASLTSSGADWFGEATDGASGVTDCCCPNGETCGYVGWSWERRDDSCACSIGGGGAEWGCCGWTEACYREYNLVILVPELWPVVNPLIVGKAPILELACVLRLLSRVLPWWVLRRGVLMRWLFPVWN